MMSANKLSVAASILCAASLCSPEAARAFCGFYVSGASGDIYNEATKVVLMRVGTRTVLSMQNSYQGPPEDFAMVVPVPVVLHQGDVKTLRHEVFDRIDQLAAPRLVEYWERDPCAAIRERRFRTSASSATNIDSLLDSSLGGSRHGVRVEAQFAVGEYDIQILSASDSSGLETWLHEEHYNVPAGAGAVLRPYVESGTKFFVAKVDVARVTFQNGRAMLSPLRVHYDSPDFSLPVRLGLLNSHGRQDLIVHILAPDQRYEVSNYPNTTIPTNIRVRDSVRDRFGEFYAQLFDKTVERSHGAVVTEYSWQAMGCDPCPTQPLDPSELSTLGLDVMGAQGTAAQGSMVLTRLHYRYDRDDLGDDLVFRPAPAIIGGRGVPNTRGRMVERTAPSSSNQFQGRYVILHRWAGPVACAHPQRGVWGGPPSGDAGPVSPATDTAFVSRRYGTPLERLVRDPIPEIGVRPGVTPAPTRVPAPSRKPGGDGPRASVVAATGAIGACSASERPSSGAVFLLSAGALVTARARRRRKRR